MLFRISLLGQAIPMTLAVKNCNRLLTHTVCMLLNAHFLVQGPFLFSVFDQSNRAWLAVPTTAPTLLHTATTLQCAAYFTHDKYQQILPLLQHDKQTVNKNRLSTRTWALNYKCTAGLGLNTLFGFCCSRALTTLGHPPPLTPNLRPSCCQHPLAAESKIDRKVLLA